MLRRALALLGVVGALAVGTARAGDGADHAPAWPGWATAQRAAFEAFARGDAKPLEAAARSAGDPGLLALLFATLRGGTEPATAARLADAARVVAQAVDARAKAAWLGRLVDGWLAWDAAQATAHAASLKLHAQVLEPGIQEKWPRVLEAAAG